MTDIAPDAPSDDGGALNIESAMAALAEQRGETPDVGETPADEPQSTEPEVEIQSGAETPAAEDEQAEEPAKPEVQAPAYWPKDKAELFAQLPADLQTFVAEQERGRESAKGKAVQEASETRKLVEQEANNLRQRNAALDDLLPRAGKMFQDKWAGVTQDNWVALARQDPDSYTRLKAEYDAERAGLQGLTQAKQQAEAQAQIDHSHSLARDLPKIAPELADPKEGIARLQKTVSFLTELGIPRTAIPKASAAELSLAYDAMRFRDGQKALASQPKPAPAPAKPTLKPSSAAPASSSQRTASSAMNRLAQTGKVEDAVALLAARRAH